MIKQIPLATESLTSQVHGWLSECLDEVLFLVINYNRGSPRDIDSASGNTHTHTHRFSCCSGLSNGAF